MSAAARRRALPLALAAVAVAGAACGPTLAQRALAADGAVEALRASRFDDAAARAAAALDRDAGNPYAAAVAAVALYKRTVHQLADDLITVTLGAIATGGVNERYLKAVLTDAEADLAGVDARLAVAAAEPGFALELCPACLEVDWNRSGGIDEFDRRLLEVELDARERPIPEGDPRRRPTFRFDRGDVLWARAFVALQRAALDLALAYRWGDAAAAAREEPVELRIRLADAGRVGAARDRILEGLDHSDAAREAYLAETDDDREWLPNPRQRSHPLPMPVDRQLYDTWEAIVGDVRRLVRGEEGLSVAEIAQLGDHEWADPPRGYVDVGRLFARPRDIIIRGDEAAFDVLERAADGRAERRAAERTLDGLFGDAYVKRMPASPLVSRLVRMKGEVERGVESFGRKLRYLVWIN